MGTVHNVDAFESKEYGRFDIIYWYTPLDDSQKMAELERQIVDEASPGIRQ